MEEIEIGPSNIEARGEIEQKNKILNRLKSIEGHVRGVQRIVMSIDLGTTP
ncbi:MAG: metal-sensing transcriptional repressor [Anaerolineae bacterium]